MLLPLQAVRFQVISHLQQELHQPVVKVISTIILLSTCEHPQQVHDIPLKNSSLINNNHPFKQLLLNTLLQPFHSPLFNDRRQIEQSHPKHNFNIHNLNILNHSILHHNIHPLMLILNNSDIHYSANPPPAHQIH